MSVYLSLILTRCSLMIRCQHEYECLCVFGSTSAKVSQIATVYLCDQAFFVQASDCFYVFPACT